MVNKSNVGNPPGDNTKSSVMVGLHLQYAREALQMSVEDVANALHITPTYVNLLEKNQFQKLPAAIFTRGYIKAYARLLNLDVDEIMKLYFQQTGDKPFQSYTRPVGNEYGVSVRKHAFKWAVGFILFILLFPTLGWWYAHRDNMETTMTSLHEASAPATQFVTLSPIVENIISPEATTVDTTADTNAELVSVTEEVQEKTMLEITQAPSPSGEQSDENAKNISGTLKMKFTGKSWVQVKDADSVTLHDTEHKAGEAVTVTGKPPFYVWAKNAKTVTLLFNGEPVKIETQDEKGVARLVVGK